MRVSSRLSKSIRNAIGPLEEQLSKGAVLMSAFTVPQDFVPAATLTEIPHVLSYFLEHSDKGEVSRLLVFWTDRESYTVGAQAFRKRAGLPAEATVEVSWIAEIEARKPPWFKRFKPYAVVLAISGFLGGLEAIHNRYGLFFGRSEAVVRFDDPRALNVRAGQPAELEILTQNNSRVVAARGKIDEVSIVAQSMSRQLRLEPPPTFGPIGPGENSEIRVPIGELDQGSSFVKVVVRLDGGLLRPVQRVELSREVEVWPDYSAGRYQVLSQKPGEVWLGGELAAGKPFEGLDCSANLAEGGAVVFQAIVMDGVLHWKLGSNLSTPGSEFALIRWRTAPLEAFSRQKYKLLLTSTAGKEISWPEVVKKIVTGCQPVEGE